ncbi:reverse transcriptase zinc-binding domain-containing protein [Artemisia annua]|uniref:Reverse transcriptase zinc-binding domain-containing protein n=1 Tax=Artemisia annua TaxID=35608 RepID=A0A2U1M327_ARTAN|nr:reverse transcriptase zinc-binding domain-containing protein [Artemisia annua]
MHVNLLWVVMPGSSPSWRCEYMYVGINGRDGYGFDLFVLEVVIYAGKPWLLMILIAISCLGLIGGGFRVWLLFGVVIKMVDKLLRVPCSKSLGVGSRLAVYGSFVGLVTIVADYHPDLDTIGLHSDLGCTYAPYGTLCPLCNAVDETHAHLFFSCCFSKIIWDNLKILCKLDNVSCIWAEIVSSISIRTANNSLWSVIQRLVFGAAVYYIWQERNLRLFQKKFRSEEAVFKIIVDIVRHKLLSLRIKRSVDSINAAVIWKIPLMSSNGENNRNQNYNDNGVK